jgi:hypothetical protein
VREPNVFQFSDFRRLGQPKPSPAEVRTRMLRIKRQAKRDPETLHSRPKGKIQVADKFDRVFALLARPGKCAQPSPFLTAGNTGFSGAGLGKSRHGLPGGGRARKNKL